MSITIQPLTSLHATISCYSVLSEIQERVSKVYDAVREHLFPQGGQEAAKRIVIDCRAIWKDPGQLVEGSIWGAWWAAGVYFLSNSSHEFCSVLSAEYSSDRSFEKIVNAAKSVFTDALSLVSSSLYTLRWADGAKVVALGHYLPLVKNLCFGTTLFISVVETGFDLHQFRGAVTGLLYEQDSVLSNTHTKRVYHLSMKLISNICMAAWAVLGIATLGGAVVSSVLMPLLLTVGCVVGIAAIYYKMQIDNK